MAIHCNICYAWNPKDWQGWKWADVTAFCSCRERYTTFNETCEHASITGDKHGRLQPNIIPANKTGTNLRKTTNVASNSSSINSDIAIDDAGDPALYVHQQEDFEYFKDRSEIALFAEMGTGKSATILAIAGYKFKKKEINALLIIAPNDVHVQWYKEQIPLWLPVPYDAQCFGGRGGAKQTWPFDPDPELLQVLCTNIDTFSTPQKWKDIVEWSNYMRAMIVLDEATVIKNVNAQRTQRMLYAFNDVVRKGKSILKSTPKSVCRAILTGTPVTNGSMDLWPMMEFLKPNYFGRNWYSFQNHFGMFTKIAVNDRVISVALNEETWRGIKGCSTYAEASSIFGCSEDTFNVIHSQDHYQGPYKNAEELRELIKPVSVFRLLKDCRDMPGQNYNTRLLTMNDDIRKCYEDMRDEFVASYEEHTATALNKMTALIRLQQISSGFISDKEFFTGNHEETTEAQSLDILKRLYGFEDSDNADILPNEIQWIGASNPKLDALYRDVEEAAKPIIIITRFSAEAARIYNDLINKHPCCLMTGWRRIGTIEEFKEGRYSIMIANTRVIAKGFNLQNSHAMFFYSNTFSLENRLQAEGRIFRIGQTEPCEYIDYSYEDTVDGKIIQSLKLKRNLLDFIRTGTMKEVVE